MKNIIFSIIWAVFILANGAEAATFKADKPTILITGANRGLGLEFARQYAAKGWNVIASCRTPDAAKDLKALAAQNDQVAIEELDVTLDAEVSALAAKYKGRPIDVLLNNAGIYGKLEKQTLGSFDFEEAKRVFDVNSIGHLRVASAFLDNVAMSDQKKIISLGGGMGTQTIGSLFGGHYFMKMSKAAQLISMGTLQMETKDKGILITMISPGHVDTQLSKDSGWAGPTITAEKSTGMVIDRIAVIDKSVAGKLIMYDGTLLPW